MALLAESMFHAWWHLQGRLGKSCFSSPGEQLSVSAEILSKMVQGSDSEDSSLSLSDCIAHFILIHKFIQLLSGASPSSQYLRALGNPRQGPSFSPFCKVLLIPLIQNLLIYFISTNNCQHTLAKEPIVEHVGAPFLPTTIL